MDIQNTIMPAQEKLIVASVKPGDLLNQGWGTFLLPRAVWTRIKPLAGRMEWSGGPDVMVCLAGWNDLAGRMEWSRGPDGMVSRAVSGPRTGGSPALF
uniref:Uncharacterized protein n=1 Tax=Trichuris muris TaxID=70415 RepID=A0A5S6QBN1_TRIMR